ncbi:AfsA-related hotdog domain-containing protein [Nocardia harenae]|uniref:AfsA-related hotdog domain-containing protein n=1 Tax=Nocardia harenae TaxID=358707 RepID=UPI0008356AE6|nr:AfsA-related hotdog domain-containing protein [Nocardia harenae]
MTTHLTRRTAAELSFEQTVPRALAHRHNLAEVMIADSAETGDDSYAVAFHVPRAHLLWFDRHPAFHDTFAAAEAARQAAFVVIHRHLGVPVGLPFTMHRFDFEVIDHASFADDRRSALQGTFHYRTSNRDRRGDQQGNLSFEGTAQIGDETALTFTGDVVFLPGDDYLALRAFQRKRRPAASAPAAPVPPLPPERVGRRDPRNVVVGEPDGDTYPIRMDRDHPAFFDHDYDHAPGPLCVEAFRQAALDAAQRAGLITEPDRTAVVAVAATFTDFAEIDAAVECVVELGPASATGEIDAAVRLCQFGVTIADGTLLLRTLH